MTTALLLLFTVLLLVCVLALMDQYATLELIRGQLGINDNPKPLPFPEHPVSPSEAGLSQDLDELDHLVLLFLSTTCATCATVASGLRGRDLSRVHVVLRAATPEEGVAWAQEVALPSERVTLDGGGQVATAFAMRTTPAAVVMSRGEIRAAQTIPSFRQLEPLLAGSGLPLPGTQGPAGRAEQSTKKL